VLGLEIMVPNSAIRNLIREDKIHQIYSIMQTGQTKFGMLTLNQSLYELYVKKQISYEDCLGRSSVVEELMQMLGGQDLRVHRPSEGVPVGPRDACRGVFALRSYVFTGKEL